MSDAVRRAFAVLVVASVLFAPSALAAPPGAPPPGAAPPAWVATGQGDFWLAFNAFCWQTRCTRYRSPDQRSDIPRLTVRRGRVVQVHFGFVPKHVSLAVVSAMPRRSLTLKAARVVPWRVTQTGHVAISVSGPQGTVSYVLRVGLTG